MERFEYAILGGGMAGLSLAAALARRGLDQRGIVILEPRTHYRRDRTWCYFDTGDHDFEDALTHAWRRWRVRGPGREVVQGPGRFRYCEIPADRFYRTALVRSAGASLRLSTSVRAVRPDGADFVVETTRGAVRAGHVFDSRPHRRHGALLQHFLGQTVEVDRPAFDPSTVDLMDFDRPQERGIHFMYVLPYDDRRALVEATWIGPSRHEPRVYRETIAAYLRSRYRVARYSVAYEESGAIPMDARRTRLLAAPGHYRIGAAAGLVKPSTGYAFLAVQQWTRALADRLARSDRPRPPPVRGRAAHALDRVFVSFLRRQPARAPDAFVRLFERTDADQLAAFLTERASAGEMLGVVRAMPTLPFLREALATCLS